jgi:hypothetical protein
MQIINSLGKHQLVPLVFAQDAVAASQSAVALYCQQVHGAVALDNIGYTMPWAGEVIGVTINTTAAASAGTLTVVPTIDTTACSDPSGAITTEVAQSDSCKRGTNPFAAEAVIGAKITTTAGWTAETMDMVVIVWVLLTISGI